MTESPSNGQPPLLALVVTNLTKLAGLVLAMHEGLRTEVRPSVLALAAFMMAGAQGVETLAKNFFGK